MSVNEVLDEIRKLSPAEKQQIIETLLRDDEVDEGLSAEERQAALFRRMLAEGDIRNIPPRSVERWDFDTVPIKGAPLSETIIEERRPKKNTYVDMTVPGGRLVRSSHPPRLKKGQRALSNGGGFLRW